MTRAAHHEHPRELEKITIGLNPGIRVALIDLDRTVKPSELAPAAAALTRQMQEDVGRSPPFGWGVTATVRAADTQSPPQSDEWILGLYAQPDLDGALGYHDRTPQGKPLMKVFPLLDPVNPWTVTASHELIEAAIDPELSLCFQDPDGRFWAGEACDAVEADTYELDSVVLSSFVLPCYFQPLSLDKPRDEQLDILGLVKRPLEIRPGGYGQYWDPLKGWTEIQEQGSDETLRAASRRMLHAMGYSRRARRRLRCTKTAICEATE